MKLIPRLLDLGVEVLEHREKNHHLPLNLVEEDVEEGGDCN
jgi:hypothetical protein